MRRMKPIATANYDFESLVKGGYVYVAKYGRFAMEVCRRSLANAKQRTGLVV